MYLFNTSVVMSFFECTKNLTGIWSRNTSMHTCVLQCIVCVKTLSLGVLCIKTPQMKQGVKQRHDF